MSEPDFRHIAVTRTDAVAVITLNDPARLNAASAAMVAEIMRALDDAAREMRAIVLAGAGRAFCAGASLSSDLDPASPDYDAGLPLEISFNPLIDKLREIPIPIVAAVQGAVAGVGASIALACDLVIAAEGAYFLEAFRHIGLVPDGGATHALVRTLGRLRANEMMMLGERITAAQALQWGLVNRVVPDRSLAEEALGLATELANGPTAALAMIKRLSWAALDRDLGEMMVAERETQRRAGRTADHDEGLRAFLEKRAPRFSGR